jgi:hypothetical protein
MLRALIEVAGLMLLLRGVLWMYGPKALQGNLVYDLLRLADALYSFYTRRQAAPLCAMRTCRRLRSLFCSGCGWA